MLSVLSQSVQLKIKKNYAVNLMDSLTKDLTKIRKYKKYTNCMKIAEVHR